MPTCDIIPVKPHPCLRDCTTITVNELSWSAGMPALSKVITVMPSCPMVHAHACRVSGPLQGQLPLEYGSWAKLRAFELGRTRLGGTIPASYFLSWPLLENFTLDGANITGYLPSPMSCKNMAYYTVQDTPVMSDSIQPLWVLDANQACSLRRMSGLRLGE